MKLAPVVAELRRRCPSFERRIYGSVEFAKIETASNMSFPCAFVLPLGENAEGRLSDVEYRQPIEQTIGVVIYVATSKDRTGMDSFDFVEDLKKEIHLAMTGWCADDETNEIQYEGLSVLDFNRACLAVQLEFSVTYDIVDEETRHGVDIASLPDLTEIALDVDLMEPDGQKEARALFNLTGGKG